MNKEINFEKIDKARKILELEERASLVEIKKAYRSLSKKWHPDRCEKGDEKLCHERMKEINKAYKILLEYVEHYCYPFSKEKVIEDSPEERWKRQFGSDHLWGTGKWQDLK
mgnify:CR=1 FL=1